MKVYHLRSKREVCWDLLLVEKAEKIRLQMHKPVYRGMAVALTQPWEGTTCGYPSVVVYEGKYRFYYRSGGIKEEQYAKEEFFCMAESEDGIHFTKPELELYEFAGSRKNNIHFAEERFVDNFSIHYDTNPDCPADARFKALSLFFTQDETGHKEELGLYKSADGIRFEFVRILPVKGVFDTHNILLWDDREQLYKMYIRDFHDRDGRDAVYEPDDAVVEPLIRDVRITTSVDLEHWTVPERIRFQEGAEEVQLYTSQIFKYHRSDIYLGIPVRYSNRIHDAAPSNFEQLPAWYGERCKLLEKGSRQGSAVTDAVLMTSRDGYEFERCDNAFFTSGPETDTNWRYGDCYFAHGIAETPVEGNPGKTELSLYTREHYHYDKGGFARYTVRLDGFFSWRGDFEGGSVLTKPVTFEGEKLQMNFATSGLGGIRVELCDVNGFALEGYDSGVLFGDSTERCIVFEKSLKELWGKAVRLKITLKDADLYSFRFV